MQTPTLALIVKRQQENRKLHSATILGAGYFIPGNHILCHHPQKHEELAQEESDAKENPKKAKKAEENRGIPPIIDLATGQALMERVKNVPFTVTEVAKKTRNRSPPPSFRSDFPAGGM